MLWCVRACKDVEKIGIIAPAEKYTIFKNKSKRKLMMDNTTMLGLLLQCTLVVSETR